MTDRDPKVDRFAEELRKWWSFDDRQMHTHSWHSREDFIERKLPELLRAALARELTDEMAFWELTDELAFWREAHETARTKGAALVAWGVYAVLRIAKDGSLDDAHKEMASQLFEQRARIEHLEADKDVQRSQERNASYEASITELEARIKRLEAEVATLRNFMSGILHNAQLALAGQDGP